MILLFLYVLGVVFMTGFFKAQEGENSMGWPLAFVGGLIWPVIMPLAFGWVFGKMK